MTKDIFLIVFTIACFCISCKKDQTVANDLIGEWELNTSVEGMTGKATKVSAGMGNILDISEDIYKRYEQGTLAESGTYCIVKEKSILYNKVSNRIVFDGEYNTLRTFFRIENDELLIWIDAYDAPSIIYRRLK